MKSKTQKTLIDPNQKASAKDGIYGLPFSESESQIVFLPIPWDVTTSYQAGTSKGPEAILKASEQIDFFDLDYVDVYKVGLHLRKIPTNLKKMNARGRGLATKIINASESEIDRSKTLKKALNEVNQLSEELNQYIYSQCQKLLQNKKTPIILGGDHSTPFGAIKAYSEQFKDLGILHIDAHSDTRNAYMGFKHSHASIMYNVLENISGIKKLIQVGIRDFCEDEFLYTQKNKKVTVFFDKKIQEHKMKGHSFSSLADKIVAGLPQNIYISFDIDGLDPRYAPHTGTPVPGGLEYAEFIELLHAIVRAGKKIVGFDLVEVAPNLKDKNDEWDANVAMRLIYKMAGASMHTQGFIERRNS